MLLQSFWALIFRLHYFSFLGFMMFVLFTRLMIWDRNFKYQHQTLKTEIFCLHFLGLFYEIKAFSFLLFSFFTFAFFFSFKFGFMCGRNVSSRSNIVSIVWVLFCFLQTKNWVQVWVPNNNFIEIKNKWELWIKNCELWVMRMRTRLWKLRHGCIENRTYINFQIFDHTCICPIWALN